MNHTKKDTLFGQYLAEVKKRCEGIPHPPLGDVKDAYDGGLTAAAFVRTWKACQPAKKQPLAPAGQVLSKEYKRAVCRLSSPLPLDYASWWAYARG